jgi:hypothetical protein
LHGDAEDPVVEAASDVVDGEDAGFVGKVFLEEADALAEDGEAAHQSEDGGDGWDGAEGEFFGEVEADGCGGEPIGSFEGYGDRSAGNDQMERLDIGTGDVAEDFAGSIDGIGGGEGAWGGGAGGVGGGDNVARLETGGGGWAAGGDKDNLGKPGVLVEADVEAQLGGLAVGPFGDGVAIDQDAQEGEKSGESAGEGKGDEEGANY